jgi:cobalamin-dependent methionine synthase I
MSGIIVLGENLNASRKCKLGGKLAKEMPDGKMGFPYKDLNGEDKYVDLTRIAQRETVQKTKLAPYVAAAVENRDEMYVATVIKQQADAGADIIDLNVDEVSTNRDERKEHMIWFVTTAQKHSDLSMSVDSSDPETVVEGLKVYDQSKGQPFINSTNLEPKLLVLLEEAKKYNAMIAGNASGPSELPKDVAGRMKNLTQLMAKMDECDIPMQDRFLDPLVFPVGTGADMMTGEFIPLGRHFLDTAQELRKQFGEEFHIFGGLSNVSFGMPQRKLLNVIFSKLCIQAGCDTIMVDPLQIGKKEANDFYYANRALTGKDEFFAEFLQYSRS